MSLKRKIQYVYTISSAVVAFALVLGILLSIKGMSMLTDTLDNNDKALKLYKAVTKERNALKLYFEDEQAELPEQIDEVRNNTKDILGQIPADFNYCYIFIFNCPYSLFFCVLPYIPFIYG